MSGKRLIDAAKLLSVGGSVVKKHASIRREQWDLFAKTSSLVKAVRSQTDRVTVTVGAAVELAKRFNETGPSWQRGPEDDTRAGWSTADDVRKGTSNTVKNAATAPANTARDAGLAKTAEIISNVGAAEKATDDGTLASLRRREQQRQAESQIPTYPSGPQVVEGEAGWDDFNQRSGTAPQEPSSLPRMKLPRHVRDTPDGGTDIQDPQLNQDVFPAPEQVDSSKFAAQEQSLGEINTDIFHSPKLSRMMGESGSKVKHPFASRQRLPPKPLPEMIEASKRWEQERMSSRSDVERANLHKTSHVSGDNDMESIASEIRKANSLHVDSTNVDGDHEANTSYEMRESRVPATRFGRIWQYGGLATSMAFGAVGEGFRRMAGGASTGSLMLSEGNMERLVAKLSRMRGAALKLGQMMSFQDSKVLPPAINKVLQRVQDSADYMPPSQRDKVLSRNLGTEWRDLFSSFEEKPFAAASIGQVHRATLKSNGKDVAVKIQYPGVRNSIDSDLNNLSLLLTASQLLPRGLFLDKTIANARTELGWECDYEREAKACIKFKEELLNDEQETFTVPTVYTEASGVDVLTAEFMHGKGVTKISDLTQHERDWIGTNILRLCLRELMEFKFMQTDPNWTNFLYNREEKKLELLDFGASREFSDDFVKPYVELLMAASRNDRTACQDLSIQLGYLTGRESPAMLKAHVDSILTLAEPFVASAPEFYDFDGQTVTDRVRENIGLMLKERLAPPPEETYSLHRKLSGAFLLCARLRSKVPAREMFATAADVWRGKAATVNI
jgi:aarF domain-containing kinase